MRHSIGVFTLYFMLHYFINLQGLELIFERTKVTETNKKYITDVHASVRRQKRHGIYVFNVNATLIKTWTNNVTMELIFYEYLHNEFRRSFIEMRFGFCDFATKDPIMSPIAKMTGITCPLYAGSYSFSNISSVSPAIDQLPYKWPFEKGKVVIILKTVAKNEKIVEGYIIISFKQ